MENYEFQISRFVDNELHEEEQAEFFTLLSKNKEARKTLAEYFEIKKEAKTFYFGLNPELDNLQLPQNVAGKRNIDEKKYKISFYFSAVAAIILGFLLLSNSIKNNSITEQYLKLQWKYISLKKNYKAVLNKKTELVKLTKKPLLKNKSENISGNLQNNNLVLNKKKNHKKYEIQGRNFYRGRKIYAVNIPVFTVTKNDFLGHQIVGN